MSGKRGKGEGSVHRLPSGSWQSQIMDGYTDEGKRHIVSFTAPTRAEALEQMREYLQNKPAPGSGEAQEVPLFEDYAKLWYESYRSQVEESTWCNYGYTIKLLNKAFGHLRLTDVKTVQVNRFINELESRGYSASQISKCRSLLIQILDVAEADDLVVKNYARRAFRTTKRLSKSQRAHHKDAFTVEEAETLLEKLPEDLLGNSIRLMLVTGLRLQELLALTPKDIAADGSWVRVNKAVKMVNGIPKLGSPKSFTSRRVVPPHRPLAAGERGPGLSLVRAPPGQPALRYLHRAAEVLQAVGPVPRRPSPLAPLLPAHLCDAAAEPGRPHGDHCPAHRAHRHQNHRPLSAHLRRQPGGRCGCAGSHRMTKFNEK